MSSNQVSRYISPICLLIFRLNFNDAASKVIEKFEEKVCA